MSEEKKQNIQSKKKDQEFKDLLAESPKIIQKLEASLHDSTNYFPSSKTNDTSLFKEKCNSMEFLCSVLHFFLAKEPPNAIRENAHYKNLINGEVAEDIPIKVLTTRDQDTDNEDMYLADLLKIKPITIQFLTKIIPKCIKYINKPEHAEGAVAFYLNRQSTEKILRNATLHLIEFTLITIQIFKKEIEKDGSDKIKEERNFIIMKYALGNMWKEINPDIKDPNNPNNRVNEEHIQNLDKFSWEIPLFSLKPDPRIIERPQGGARIVESHQARPTIYDNRSDSDCDYDSIGSDDSGSAIRM